MVGSMQNFSFSLLFFHFQDRFCENLIYCGNWTFSYRKKSISNNRDLKKRSNKKNFPIFMQYCIKFFKIDRSINKNTDKPLTQLEKKKKKFTAS